MGWICPKCRVNNYIENKECANQKCLMPRPPSIPNEEGELHKLVRESKERTIRMTENEQLFADFYSSPEVQTRLDSMSIDDIVQWELRLEKKVIEAKAVHKKVADTRKERAHKLSKEQRDKLITVPETTEAINAIKVRKDRMSRADKLAQLLKDTGAGGDFINQVMSGIKSDSKSQAIHNNNGGQEASVAKVKELTLAERIILETTGVDISNGPQPIALVEKEEKPVPDFLKFLYEKK